jgi:hypothetical protein
LRADVTIVLAGAGTVTGNVEFLQGELPLGFSTVDHGAATINVVLPSGSHNITARYLGSDNVSPSTGTLVQTVNSRQESTATTLRVRPSQSNVGDEVTFDISVDAPSGTPTGTVEILDGGVPITTLQLSGTSVTHVTRDLAAGSHTALAIAPKPFPERWASASPPAPPCRRITSKVSPPVRRCRA